MADRILIADDERDITDMLARFFRERGYEIVLHPENSEMDDIIVPEGTEFRILGTAVGLMRNSFSD